jgi:hypothetical protein
MSAASSSAGGSERGDCAAAKCPTCGLLGSHDERKHLNAEVAASSAATVERCDTKNVAYPNLVCGRPKGHAGPHVFAAGNGAWGWPQIARTNA